LNRNPFSYDAVHVEAGKDPGSLTIVVWTAIMTENETQTLVQVAEV
jgi:hypothetical protein